MKNIFTDEELAQMGRLTLEVLNEAIDSGDKDKSKRLAKRMLKEFQAMHDLYCNWVAGLITYIGEKYGEEAVAEAQRQGVGAWLKPTLQTLDSQEFKRQVEMFVAGVRGHLRPITVVEDEEKVTIVADPCGSGGRLARGETGFKDFIHLKKPAPITFGRKDLPAYCTHCAMDDILSIEWYGYPKFVCDPPDKIGEKACRTHLYKDPAKIPASVYERAGKKKKQ